MSSSRTKEQEEADFLDCVVRTRKIYVGQSVFDALKGCGAPLPDGSVLLPEGVTMALLKYAEKDGIYAFEDFVLNPRPLHPDARRRHP